MSHEAVAWALHDAPMPLTEKGKPDTTARYVLVDLAEHASAGGLNSYPSLLHIQYATGLDERTVRRALRRLEAGGLIHRDGVARNGNTRWKLALAVTRPETDWAFLEAEKEEQKRRETDGRRTRRNRSAAEAVSGTQNAGHDGGSALVSGTENPGQDGNVGLSGTESSGQPTDSEAMSGTQNPGVRDAESRRPARNAPRTVITTTTTTGGHAAPRTPLRGNDPAGRFTDEASSPHEVVDSGITFGTEPTTRAGAHCEHGLRNHLDPITGEPRCPFCRRGGEAP